jgi:hypothetical protein
MLTTNILFNLAALDFYKKIITVVEQNYLIDCVRYISFFTNNLSLKLRAIDNYFRKKYLPKQLLVKNCQYNFHQ